MESLAGNVEDRKTAVLLGPSGAGKSTLNNALLGKERQETGEVRMSDHRGRRTTVVRELVQLPGGGILLDTPGLRALALTGSEVEGHPEGSQRTPEAHRQVLTDALRRWH